MGSTEPLTSPGAASNNTRNSDAKYRRLFERMTEAFASADMQGNLIEANPAFVKLVGYSEEELLQLTYGDLTPKKWHALEERIREEQVLTNGHSELFQKEYRRKDGSIVPVELKVFLINAPDGTPCCVWAIVRDITERVQLEQALRDSNARLEKRVEERTAELRDSESRFRRLAEASFEAVSVTDRGNIVDLNDQCSEMLGWERDELIGRSVIEFVRPEFRDIVSRHIRDGSESAYECEVEHRDGRIVPCAVRGKMTDWQGRQLRVTVIRDLTEVKRTEAKLAEQRAALSRLQHMALLSGISTGVVHQISQPISAILNNVAAARKQIASCDTPHGDALATLREINGGLDRLRETIDRLRALAHPERQRHTLLFLGPILRDAIRDVESDARSREVILAVSCPADLPRLSGDAAQLRHVFINILQNAIDAVAANSAHHRHVSVTADTTPANEIEVLIKDCGSGIDPDAERQIFDPLFTTKEQGTGIGLTFCRTIITAHNGRIGGANNVDEPGATFRVTLPTNGGTE